MRGDALTLDLAGLDQQAGPANPCVTVWGPGPEGERCRSCRHLVRPGANRAWPKCSLRAITRGAATDHRVTWPACGRWEAA